MTTSITAETIEIDGVGAHVKQVGRSLGRREEPLAATLDCPLVPEASEFLRALSSARDAHASCLSSLSSFFDDASTALHGFSSEIQGHERTTSDAWERWRV